MAAAYGWEAVWVYIENHISASTRPKKKRPEYAAMVAAVESGTVDVIVSYSNGRLARRPLELEDLIKLHEKTGVQIHTVKSGKRRSQHCRWPHGGPDQGCDRRR
jgi:DNA invertase Pin-like site-specific DNA recombinase